MAAAAVVPLVAQPELKLFGRWTLDEIEVKGISLADYIPVYQDKHATILPDTVGQYSFERCKKVQCPIVDKLTNSLMLHGHQLMAVRIVKHAMEIIHLLTDQNPIQVIVDAVINSGPREAGYISPFRRVNQAIYFLTTGARESASRNVKTIAQCLANELINAAKGSSKSYAMKKKDKIGRVTKANY